MTRPRWGPGLGLVALLLVAYFGAVRPARLAFARDLALPLFQEASAPAGGIDFELREAYVRATGPGVGGRAGTDVALYKTPLGDRPMLGVLVLALLFPARRWWLALAATALLEGVLTTACFAAGAHGVGGAFVAHRVVQAVLNDTLPLALPALVYVLSRSGRLPSADLPSADEGGADVRR